MTDRQKIFGLIVSVILCLAAGELGAIATTPERDKLGWIILTFFHPMCESASATRCSESNDDPSIDDSPFDDPPIDENDL